MTYGLFVSIFCSISSVILGIYVFRKTEIGQRKIRIYFLILTCSLSAWVLGSGFRNLLPENFLRTAPNWILLSTVLVPITLHELVCFLTKENFNPSRVRRLFEIILLAFLFHSGIQSNLIAVSETSVSIYKPMPAYHVLIAYSILYVGRSIFLLIKKSKKSNGMLRLQAFILMLGVASALFVAILFVYILPLFGIFKGYLSAFGVLSWVFCWTVAILHYDAFEIREKILEGKDTPIISRILSGVILFLYNLLDPKDYSLRISESKLSITAGILFENYYLKKSFNMNYENRKKVITEKFKHRLK